MYNNSSQSGLCVSVGFLFFLVLRARSAYMRSISGVAFFAHDPKIVSSGDLAVLPTYG